MKVCIIYNPLFQGAKNLVEALSEQDIEILHIVQGIHIRNPPSNYLQISTKSKRSMVLDLLKAKRKVRQFRPDIIHLIETEMKSIWAHFLRGRTPLVVTPTGTDIREHSGLPGLFMWSQQLALSSCSAATSNGADISQMLQSFGVPRERIVPLYFGVSQDILKFVSPSLSDENQGNEIKSFTAKEGYNPITIITGQKLDPAYGPLVLTQTIKEVLDSRSDVKFRIAGSGSFEKTMKKKLASYSKNVEFLGHLSHELYLRELSRADIFLIVTTNCSGVPISLLEAMLFEKVIVSVNIAAYTEFAIDEKTAIVREPDARILSQGILWAIDNWEKAKPFGKQAYNLVRKTGLSSVNAKRLMNTYSQLMH